MISNLIVTPNFPPAIGGIERCARELWSYGGFGNTAVLTARTGHDDAAFDAQFPGAVHRTKAGSGLGNRLRFIGTLALQLMWRLPRTRAVHLFNMMAAPVLLPSLPFWRRPLIVWAFGLEITHPKLQPLVRLLFRRADRIVIPSEFTRELVLRRGGRARSIVKIKLGGDDLRERHRSPDGAAFRRRFAIEEKVFLILSVSRLDPLNRYKGIDRTIEVVALLRDFGIDFRWVVVGGGPDLEYYRERARISGAATHLEFTGQLDDAVLAEAYAACDLFCLLSREELTPRGLFAEGYGIVFVEAASFAKPVLGLRRGGVPDAVADGQTGVLLDADEPLPIAREIARLARDPAERKRLGDNGFAHATGSASWSASRQQLGEMLDTLNGGAA